MARFASALLYLIAAALGRLPWPALYGLADGLAWLWARLDARESHVARVNLKVAYPEMPAGEREQWHRAILRTTARQFLETLRFWTRPHAGNLELITRSHGTELFDAALASGKGLIVAAPHYGNWELLNQWLASRTPISVLYRPPEAKVGEAFLRQVLETLRFWTRPHAGNLELITRSHGTELFDAALASGKGLIVAAPHYGNWELLNQWLASRTPISVLYRPPEAKVGEAFLRRVRGDSAEQVTQVRADRSEERRVGKECRCRWSAYQ